MSITSIQIPQMIFSRFVSWAVTFRSLWTGPRFHAEGTRTAAGNGTGTYRRAVGAGVAAILSATACSGPPPSPSSGAGALSAASTIPGGTGPADPQTPGLVWEITGGKARFFVGGTFHLLRAEDYPLPRPYVAAWEASEHLVTEIPPGSATDPETAAALRPLLRLEPGTTLPGLVSVETWQQLSRWAERTGTPLKGFENQPPWLAGLAVTLKATSALGCLPEYGMERHFGRLLPGSGKTSEGLETPAGQMRVFSRFPATIQEGMLRQALSDTDILAEKAGLLSRLWRQGDADGLYARLEETFAPWPEVKSALLDERNAAWMPRLEALLASGKPTLVLTGAAHLGGPGGLIARLEAAGYRSRRLLPAAPSQTPPGDRPSPVPDPKSRPGLRPSAPPPVKKAA